MSESVTNVPHMLPPGWRWSTFATVATIASNLVPPKEWADKPHIAPDNIERDTGRLLPFRTIAEDSVTSPKHLFRPGQLLYSKIRPYLNKCVRISFHGLCSADMYPLDAHIEAGYLHYYILSQQFVSAVTMAAGSRTVLPKTNQEQLSDVPIPVAPEPEQRRIAEEIESYFTRLDDAVATLERAERNLKRYRASVLKSAVEGRLVPTEAALAKQESRDYEPAYVLLERILTERSRRWAESGKKGKYQAAMPPDTTKLPALPDGWSWATLGQVAPLQGGFAFSSSGYRTSGVRLLKGNNVRDGWLSKDEVDYWQEEAEAELTHYRLSEGDVVLAMDRPVYSSGSKATKVAILGPDWDGALLLQRVGCFRRFCGLEGRYLYLFVSSANFREHIVGGQKGSQDGKDLPHVSAGHVDACPFPLPPVAEQRRIVEAAERLLSVALAGTQSLESSRRRCMQLRQCILKRAFEGKLADQDPTDEPASVLLARIKAERDKTQPAKKKSRA